MIVRKRIYQTVLNLFLEGSLWKFYDKMIYESIILDR